VRGIVLFRRAVRYSSPGWACRPRGTPAPVTAAATARRTARKAADSDGVRGLARLGLAARGTFYLVVAVLAANVARGSRSEADRQGALRTLGSHPLGRAALVAAACGFAGYALWRLAEATVRPGDKGVPGRAGSAAKALLYAGFFVTTLDYVLTSHASNANRRQTGVTARVLGWPLGRWLVAAAGAALLVAGVWNVWRAVSGRYRKHLKDHELSRNAGRWVSVVAVSGLVARGVAFGLVGAFLVQAAVTYDPAKAQGLDGSLRRLAQASYGRPLVVLVAAGLAAYGLWSFVEARYRRVLGS
jgi:hypothetical protein